MSNIQFLKNKPELYKLIAETQAVLLKEHNRFVAINCRSVCEIIVKEMMGNQCERFRNTGNMADRIDHLQIEEAWKEKLHFIRKIGNRAAHNEPICRTESKLAYDYTLMICRWQYETEKPAPQEEEMLIKSAIGLLSAALAVFATVKTMNYVNDRTKNNPII